MGLPASLERALVVPWTDWFVSRTITPGGLVHAKHTSRW